MDRHLPVQCFLINIGRVRIQYGASPGAWLDSEPRLYAGDDSLHVFEPEGSRYRPLEGPLLGAMRAVEELRALAALAKQSDPDIPTIALIDGSLILWGLAGQAHPDFVRTALLEDLFLPAMEELRQMAMSRPLALASYISLPRSTEVVNALRLDSSLCHYEAANCDMHCRALRPGQRPCDGVSGVLDRDMFGALLEENERSDLFASTSLILEQYGDHRVRFFYLNAGSELARVEVPKLGGRGQHHAGADPRRAGGPVPQGTRLPRRHIRGPRAGGGDRGRPGGVPAHSGGCSAEAAPARIHVRKEPLQEAEVAVNTEPRLGEVVETSTTGFWAQCYRLYESPPLGALVRTGGPYPAYAVVHHVSTQGIDASRRPVARGADEASEEDVYLSNPQLSQLLRTDFQAIVVGHSINGDPRYHLPPTPPPIYAFVYACEPEEIRRFTSNTAFLRPLATSGIPALEEVVAACLSLASVVQTEPSGFLVEAGKQLMGILSGEFRRVEAILQRATR